MTTSDPHAAVVAAWRLARRLGLAVAITVPRMGGAVLVTRHGQRVPRARIAPCLRPLLDVPLCALDLARA